MVLGGAELVAVGRAGGRRWLALLNGLGGTTAMLESQRPIGPWICGSALAW